MKTQVVKRFKDKHTKEIYETGSTYDGEQKRVEELQSLGYLAADSLEEIKNPDQVEGETPSLLEGNVEDVKKALEGLPADELAAFLEEEKAGKKRTGVIKHLESLLTKE